MGMGAEMLLLGIDTCGPDGSVALGRATAAGMEILGERALAGRSYSATLVTAVRELLEQEGISLGQVDGIVAVNGPGSFTGVRVGLSAVKGLAEGQRATVTAVSRLEVLAAKAGAEAAALDAHRNEIFLRVSRAGTAWELLAGREELAAERLGEKPVGAIGVCEEAAERELRAEWPEAELARVDAPTAADALRLCAARVAAGETVELALLDGNYLRRSDAEIFGGQPGGEAAGTKMQGKARA